MQQRDDLVEQRSGCATYARIPSMLVPERTASSPPEIQSSVDGEDTVFRGQRGIYPRLLPSGLRGSGRAPTWLGSTITEVYSEAYAIPERAAQMMASIEEGYKQAEGYVDQLDAAGPFEPMPPPPISVVFAGIDLETTHPDIGEHRYPPDPTARLQHYGVPTSALDVTYDASVAWWFATHERVQVDGRLTYRPAREPGVVYALHPAAGIDLLDLRRRFWHPTGGQRGIAQDGGLLVGATAGEPSLDRCVVGAWTVPPGPQPGVPAFRTLFPPPDEDPLYSALLDGEKHANPHRRELAEFVDRYVYD